MKLNTLRSWAPAVLALAATLAVTACGGNDDDDLFLSPLDPTMVPSSATANATAFSTYVGSLPASDTADPLVVSAVVAPTSESDDPITVTR